MKATWWSRAGATTIDALIVTAVALVVGVVLSAGGLGSTDSTIAIYIVAGLVSLVYSPVLMARGGDDNGQTIGKRALGIRVVHLDGGPMTVPRGLLRDGVGKLVLGVIPFYTFADAVAPLFDQQKQAFHDRVGRTVVVHAVDGPTEPADPFASAARPQVQNPVPHESWSAPSQPAAGPLRPPPAQAPAPTPVDRPLPPPPPPAPEELPDLGDFAPPAPPPKSEDDERRRGPFGPSYDD